VARTRATRAAEKETQQRQKDLQGRIGSGLIGGAFPLLFGQGGGASIGGLLGGVLGGGAFGFGTSLVGTLLGSQVDQLNQRFGELANALEDPIANFDQFIQKATLASKAQESLARALQETGQNAAAAALIQQEASRTIDPISAQGAVIAQDDFNRALSNTQDVLSSIVSGPATGFLNFLTSTLQLISGTPQQGTTNPITNSFRTADTAAQKLGTNIGGILAGAALTAGGIAALLTGAGAPIGVGLIGAGLTTAGIGAAGAGSAIDDTRVATSEAVITAELAIVAAKERQVALERQVLQARISGTTGLEQQISLRAQLNSLSLEELQGRSRIQQELARKADGLNDLEDQAQAIRQEKELTAAIELRRQTLVATATAARTAAADNQLAVSRQQLKDLQATQGLQGIALKQAQAQLEVDKARAQQRKAISDFDKTLAAAGFNREDPFVKAASKDVETAANNVKTALLAGSEALKAAGKDAAERFIAASRQLLDARLALSEIQANPQGLNRFLTGDETFKRTQAAITSLGPELEAALQRGTELLRNQGVGVGRPLFEDIRRVFEGAQRGTFASPEGLQKITQFIRDVNAEADAIGRVGSATDTINEINQELVSVNSSLVKEVAALVEKAWSVEVSVDAYGGSTVYGDVVNTVLSGS
jgi:hypothetical protein